jgi:hypothetical protein
MPEPDRVTTREFYDKLTAVELRLMKRLDDVRVDIRDLQISKATLEGKADQKAVYWVYFISSVGTILAVISLVIR